MSKYIAAIHLSDIARIAILEGNGRSLAQVKGDADYILNGGFYDMTTSLSLIKGSSCLYISCDVMRSPIFCAAIRARLMPMPYAPWVISVRRIIRRKMKTLLANYNNIIHVLYHLSLIVNENGEGNNPLGG